MNRIELTPHPESRDLLPLVQGALEILDSIAFSHTTGEYVLREALRKKLPEIAAMALLNGELRAQDQNLTDLIEESKRGQRPQELWGRLCRMQESIRAAIAKTEFGL